MLPFPLLVQLHGKGVCGVHDRGAQNQQNCLDGLRCHDVPCGWIRGSLLSKGKRFPETLQNEIGPSHWNIQTRLMSTELMTLVPRVRPPRARHQWRGRALCKWSVQWSVPKPGKA